MRQVKNHEFEYLVDKLYKEGPFLVQDRDEIRIVHHVDSDGALILKHSDINKDIMDVFIDEGIEQLDYYDDADVSVYDTDNNLSRLAIIEDDEDLNNAVYDIANQIEEDIKESFCRQLYDIVSNFPEFDYEDYL